MEICARVDEDPAEASKAIPTFASPQQEVEYIDRVAGKEDLFAQNELLVSVCESHNALDLKLLLESRKEPFLIFHAVKSVNSLVENKDYDLLKTMIRFGLDLSHLAFRGIVPRMVIMLAGNEVEFERMLQILVDGGVLVDDSEPESCSTGLHIACLRLDISIVNTLLKFKANPNPVNRFMLMPLNLVENEDCDEAREIKEILLKAGGQSKWNNYMD